MSMTAVREVVAAPVRTPYRYGLFSVLDFAVATRGGIQLAWDSIGCADLQVVADPCLNEDGSAHTKVGNVACENTGGVVAMTVIAYDDSSLGRDRQVSSDRARNKLALGEQYAVENTLSTAFAGSTPTDVTGSITVPFVSASGPTDLWVAAIGQVETEINQRGGEGIVFLPRSAAGLVSGYVSTTGSVARTMLGTPVAFLSGWGFGVPAAVGVTAMLAARGPVAEGNGWNMEINDHSIYAERDYSLGWECDVVFADPDEIVPT